MTLTMRSGNRVGLNFSGSRCIGAAKPHILMSCPCFRSRKTEPGDKTGDSTEPGTDVPQFLRLGYDDASVSAQSNMRR
jgi:hypothetical protein